MKQDSEKQQKKDEDRPDPELLLKRYRLRDSDQDVSPLVSAGKKALDEDEDYPQRARGRLRIYLGAVAGVGKTYVMLNEGRRRKERGTDIVVGFVETHHRAQTEAQIGDVEVIPRKQIPYRGVTLEEMDVEAIIKRHPRVALIDELAHTNVPGASHPKRYQDVEDILAAGIDVVTTLNVQHLESLNDLVESITGIKVRETLPDHILDQADEVELVDIAPYALRQRMKHGNIYPPERIEAALRNFFREGNLTALREIALRRTAAKTESQLEQYMSDHDIRSIWPTTERVLVGFDHREHSKLIIRDAWKLAHGLDAELIAVWVELEGSARVMARLARFFRYGTGIKQKEREATKCLEENALLAEDLGAEVIRLKSNDIATTLLGVARSHRVTQIVLGQPTSNHWEEFLRGSTMNRLLRMSRGIEVHIVPRDREEEK